MKYFTLFAVVMFLCGVAAAGLTLLAVNWLIGPIGAPMLHPALSLPMAGVLFVTTCFMGWWHDNRAEEEGWQ